MIEPCSFTVHEHQVLFFGSCVLFQEVRADARLQDVQKMDGAPRLDAREHFFWKAVELAVETR